MTHAKTPGPCTAVTTEPEPTTEKRPRPRPKAGSDVAFNDECCNYRFESLSVVLLYVLVYTPVGGPHGPLTRRYAPTAAKPCRDHSDGAQRLLCRFKRGCSGLAGRGVITASAVMLFSSSLRCGGLRRQAPPMRSRASENLLMSTF